MPTRAAFASFALAALVAAPAPVFADVVSPPPTDCPEGSGPVDFCHGPPTCSASTCATDEDCAGELVCRDRDLCTLEHCCSGRCCAMDCGSPPTKYTHVEGPCGAGGTCDGFGASCTSIRVCVRPSPEDAGAGDEDAGSADEDAGGEDLDAGGEDPDAGDEGTDAGDEGMDAGDEGMDAGDGTSGETDGGCCSVVGARSGVGGGLFASLLALTVVRRLRRR
ncbi:MAG TPA: hypothetical protein RMH99_19065 [Sandaracinaceae bacterium LLY-WYZ-13_1]|nr:hypothetical protein [Sandaracinaceae bacterium LLY-WYZ-13_1]